ALSLNCPQAFLASGSAARPASLTLSPAVLVPSTTVEPTPLAVSLIPSPVVFAPLSTWRAASFTLESSVADAGPTEKTAIHIAATAAVSNVFIASPLHGWSSGSILEVSAVTQHGSCQDGRGPLWGFRTRDSM